MIRYSILGLLLVTSPAVGALALFVAHDGVHDLDAVEVRRVHLGTARVSEPTVLFSVAPEERVISTRPALSAEVDWGTDWGRPAYQDDYRNVALTGDSDAPATAPRPAERPRSMARAAQDDVSRARVAQMATVIPLLTPGIAADMTQAVSAKEVATASALSERGSNPAPRFFVGIYR